MEQLKAFIKYVLSFFKKDWEIRDYPIRFRIQKNVSDNSRYAYQIINWWTVVGVGSNKEAAYESLKVSFQDHIKAQGYKPRPGTKQEIEFASTQILDENYDILEHFIINILGFTKDAPLFISDGSSLWDFSTGEPEEDYINYLKKIKKIYGLNLEGKNVDKISDIILLIKEKWGGTVPNSE